MTERCELKITRRKLPHWTLSGSIYFITFKLQSGILTNDERSIIFQHILAGNNKYYSLIAYVVMPNHVHLLLTIIGDNQLTTIMKSIKGVTARKINRHRNKTGSIWLAESYDHIIRNQNEFYNTIQYISDNPQRAGLIKENEKYPFLYLNKNSSP